MLITSLFLWFPIAFHTSNVTVLLKKKRECRDSNFRWLPVVPNQFLMSLPFAFQKIVKSWKMKLLWLLFFTIKMYFWRGEWKWWRLISRLFIPSSVLWSAVIQAQLPRHSDAALASRKATREEKIKWKGSFLSLLVGKVTFVHAALLLVKLSTFPFFNISFFFLFLIPSIQSCIWK